MNYRIKALRLVLALVAFTVVMALFCYGSEEYEDIGRLVLLALTL